MIHKKVEEYIIYFGKIYFPVRQMKHIFFPALERIGFKEAGKFIYVQHAIPDRDRWKRWASVLRGLIYWFLDKCIFDCFICVLTPQRAP